MKYNHSSNSKILIFSQLHSNFFSSSFFTLGLQDKRSINYCWNIFNTLHKFHPRNSWGRVVQYMAYISSNTSCHFLFFATNKLDIKLYIRHSPSHTWHFYQTNSHLNLDIFVFRAITNKTTLTASHLHDIFNEKFFSSRGHIAHYNLPLANYHSRNLYSLTCLHDIKITH